MYHSMYRGLKLSCIVNVHLSMLHISVGNEVAGYFKCAIFSSELNNCMTIAKVK